MLGARARATSGVGWDPAPRLVWQAWDKPSPRVKVGAPTAAAPSRDLSVLQRVLGWCRDALYPATPGLGGHDS